jgi:integrase
MKFSIQNVDAMRGKNRYRVPFEKLDIKAQLTVLLDVFGSDHQNRNKGVGSETKKARAYIIYQFVDDLRKNGLPIKNILNIGQRHIKAAVDLWLKGNLEASTICWRLTILRWLCKSIGKNGMMHGNEYYGIPEDRVARTYVATTDKSWVGNDVLTSELIDKVKNEDEWVGMNMELMQQFGLRIRESVLIRPSLSDGVDSLTVEEGTKGGRTRVVQIRNEKQREILDKAKRMAQQNQRKAMVHPGKTPKQSIRRIYYICEKFGITRAQLNITPHGLRHEFANDRFEEIAGAPSAVRGGSDPVDIELDNEARSTVTRELGHARLDITTAYTGARKKGRPQKIDVNQPHQGDKARP